jgi:endonuclease I
LGFILAVGFLLVARSAHATETDPRSNSAPTATPDYYAGIDPDFPLRPQLHDLIDDHLRRPYPSEAGGNVLDLVRVADEEPGEPEHVRTIYRNSVLAWDSYPESWNREHAWPKSYGFPTDSNCNYPFTDAHHIFAADSGYNSSRGNLPFDYCTAGCSQKPVDGWPDAPNLRKGQGATGTWEVWPGRRGDVARALLYLDVRYEGGQHRSGCDEPDLVLTDDRAVIKTSSDNEPAAYMGVLSSLISWHFQDPVDEREETRNDIIYQAQANRSPFVDHPEWVCLVWQHPLCQTSTPALPPTRTPTATGTPTHRSNETPYRIFFSDLPNG